MLKKLSSNMDFLELRFTSLDSPLLRLEHCTYTDDYAQIPALYFPGLPNVGIAISDTGITAALPFQNAPILERCPGIAIPDKFKLAAL